EALGVDWRQITPSGRGGRVSERDILRATGRTAPELPKVSVPAVPVPEVPVAVEPQGVSVVANAMTPEQPVSEVVSSSTTPVTAAPAVPVSESPVAVTPGKQPASVPAQELKTAPEVKIAPATGALLLRRTIAQRMMESHLTTAPVTLTTSVDVTNLVNLRDQFRAMSGNSTLPVPGYAEFIIRLAALALREHPQINARWEADSVRVLSEIHIGIAVDTDSGLVVPVIRNVDQLSLRRVTQESRQLIEKARSRRLSAPEMQDGTFTVTNLGALGIDAFTPIINLPQCAVLGMGRIVRQPVFQEQQIVPRDMMTLSLTFDHRIVDGAPAARFLQSLSKSIENPAQFLID
ncbi:MAG: dihydrolipoamide acetyltransferase family protein, partial [Planctomyces sp.]